MRQLIIILLVGCSYCYYNLEFFLYINKILDEKRKGKAEYAVTFVLNYGAFVAMTVLMLHLIWNWTLFFFLLLLEIKLLYRHSWKTSCFFALEGIIVGIALNIFLRSVFSLILNEPLQAFDNQIVQRNLKQYPVFLGFIFAGVLFQVFRKNGFCQRIRPVIEDVSSRALNQRIKTVLYLYLLLNLLVYYVGDINQIVMKWWSIKSAVFAMLAVNICNIYTIRISRLNAYYKGLQKERELLLDSQEERERIRTLAYRDQLTGCYNRHYIMEMLPALRQELAEEILCFIDVDGLKQVNDIYGHPMGDYYLRNVAEKLKELVHFREDNLLRYGGDEFLVLFWGISEEEAEKELSHVNSELEKECMKGKYPFSMSISYGIAYGREKMNIEELLELADQRMYEQKVKKRKARII